MQISVTLHRGVRSQSRLGKDEYKLDEIEFTGKSGRDLMKVLRLDPEKIGLIIINGRLVNEPESVKIEQNDIIEFFPLLMGG